MASAAAFSLIRQDELFFAPLVGLGAASEREGALELGGRCSPQVMCRLAVETREMKASRPKST